MFKVHIHDGVSPIPDDPICYIVAKEGIFLKKKMGIMDSIAPVQNISILDSIQTSAKMNIKKIPGSQMARVIAFFKEVYAKHTSEAIVLLFYDETKKFYKIVPPKQKVMYASCDYDKGLSITDMQMIGTIHSHASMSAFHSGVDDKDEKHFDGLHITVGNVNDDEVSITASIVANGHRFVVQPEDYINHLKLTKDIDTVENKPYRNVYKWVDGKLVQDIEETKKFTYSVKKFDKRYIIDVSSKHHKVISAWMDMVEKKTYVQTASNPYGFHFGYGMYENLLDNWGNNFDSNLWRSSGRNVVPLRSTSNENTSPLNVGPSNNIKPLEFPDHNVEILGDDVVPCMTCAFRNHKLIAEEDGIDETEIYQCTQCKQILVDENCDGVDLTCPNCKCNDYMILLDEEDLPKHYTKIGDMSFKHTPGFKENSKYITCGVCHSSFHIFDQETQCPFCHTSLVDLIDDEFNEESQKQSDYLNEDVDKINENICETLISKIQEPTQSAIPLPVPEKIITSQGESNQTLLGMFKKVFGREKK